ncbi:MAG: phosphatidylglycerophosphatase A [Lautropia sp.]|nr:phosphatidylglycerophosphatase A [Lautropia sp.]
MDENRAEDVTDLVRADGTFGRIRPTFDFMKPRLSRWIAFGLGSGLLGSAPGTVGTLFAWISFAVLSSWLGDTGLGLLIALGLVVGHWAIDRTGRDIGVHDHGAIVWDEIVAFWLVLWVVPTDFTTQLVAFLLFRFFDIVKPAPIKAIDARWQNATGVLVDDLFAAGYTVIVMAVWSRLFG